MNRGKILAFAAVGLILALTLLNWPSNRQPEISAPIEVAVEEAALIEEINDPSPNQPLALQPLSDDSCLPPDIDRMAQLFNPYPPLLPIVETISYTGRVDWLTGRAAYLGDYASHFQTSKHFISRSLHGMGDYLSDVVSKGDRFNVLRTDKEIEFHLLLDLSRLKMWVYYYDRDEDQRVLLKSYPVCAGKLDARTLSGSLTPLGTFSLGNEIAVYRPGAIGTYKSDVVEMITIFGVRWIPFEREVAHCTGPCKGLGIHGTPCHRDNKGELVENHRCIGHYESNGCIRLHTHDIEELFSVIVSRPAFIHIVRDFTEAKLPGKEVS
ncbi:MAG: L,D-transpeptidase [Chlamydiales bacterium]|nr:L,D-transpeptidase [Chlamydiales bacterium]